MTDAAHKTLSTCIQVIFGVEDHLLKGTLDTRNRPLLHAVQGEDQPFLTLRDVEMCRGESGSRIFMPDCVIRKSQIILAIPTAGYSERCGLPPASAMEKRLQSVIMILSGYSVTGWLEIDGTTDQTFVLADEPNGFLLVAEATVRRTLNLGAPLETAALLVNKSFISMYSTGRGSPTFEAAGASDRAWRHSAEANPQGLYDEIHDLIDDMRSANERPAAQSLWFPDFSADALPSPR